MDKSEWAVYVFFYKIVRVKEINEAIMDCTVKAVLCILRFKQDLTILVKMIRLIKNRANGYKYLSALFL